MKKNGGLPDSKTTHSSHFSGVTDPNIRTRQPQAMIQQNQRKLSVSGQNAKLEENVSNSSKADMRQTNENNNSVGGGEWTVETATI